MQKELVDTAQKANIRVYYVWMPMFPTDEKRAAEEIVRSLGAEHALHFYDPQRRAGVRFVEDHFDAYMKEALATLAADHPLWEQLASLVAAPAKDKPLWDALLLFAPEAEWGEELPEPDWWTRQAGFSEDTAEGEQTGEFWRKGVNHGLLKSDWFDEAREGLKNMKARLSR